MRNSNLSLLSLLLTLVMLFSMLTSCGLTDGIVTLPDGIDDILSSITAPDEWKDYPSEHVDLDNDGFCDDCHIDVVETIDFYNFNDLHGKFDDTSSQPGVDELTTFLYNTEKTDEHTVFLSSGDMWQGSSESNVTRGNIITDWMNELGFEAMALGNHEFDWGIENIEQNAAIAEFPLLAINIYGSDTNKRVDFCESSVLIERGNCQIGIIGAIGDCYSSISGELTGGFYFKTGDDLTRLVKEESDALREQGADIVVYILHDGAERSSQDTSAYYDTELSKGGYIDIVFEGHTHQKYAFEDDYGVYHLQGGGDNSQGMTHVEVDVNIANGEIDVSRAGYVNHTQCSRLEGAPIVDELLEKYAELITWVNRDLGYNATQRNSSEIASLVARLYYEKGVEKWGEKYDVALGGGFISVRSPYKVTQGTVKYSDLQMILPFENKIVLCSIKGRDLLDKFYNTSNDRYYIYFDTVKASDINPNSTYYIITDTYTSTYRYNNLTEIEYFDMTTFACDLVAEYVENGGWSK